MAKKAGGPQTIIDEQGFETDGMFRWGGPEKKKAFSEVDLKQWVNEFNSEYSQPALERIANIRQWFTDVILPHVDGPLCDEARQMIRGRRLSHINLSTGGGCYAIQAGVPNRGYLNDAIEGIRALDELTDALVTKKATDQIVRCAIRAGMLLVRAELRAAFGPAVLAAKKRSQASAKGGKARGLTDEQKQVAIECVRAELKPAVSLSAACTRAAPKFLKRTGIKRGPKSLQRIYQVGGSDNA